MSAKPSLNDISNAAVAALKQGENVKAFDLACHALKDPRAGHLPRIVLSESVKSLKLLKFEPSVRNAILSYLDHDRVDHNKMVKSWLAMLGLDPMFKDFLDVVQSRQVSIEDWQKMEPALHDPFMTEGLRKLMVMNLVQEIFFRNVRKLSLLELWPKGLLKTRNLNFLCALAEQCFLNEFMYFAGEDEKKALAELPRDNPIAVAILGCYEPLHKHEINPKLSGVAAFRNMVNVHILEPRREAELAAEINSIGVIDDAVSKNVQAMYEENPYPRWRSLDLPLKNRPEVTGTMLIAGCGTGRTTTQIGNIFPNVELTACDISRRSIAYAMRMAEKFGNEGVTFEHRDIMTLDTMEKTFDFVECSGVLHHMADPVAGWKKLITRMKPDGIMLACLYSTKAREDVKAVRDYIAERGLEPTAENIKMLRAEIIDQKDHPLKRITRSRDFYTLSEARDLVFHIQETTYTLPELKKIIDDLGLEFYRFKMPDLKTEKLYREKFPDDPNMKNLDNWHEFENARPETFAGMYKMIFTKKGAAPNHAALSMVKVAYVD
jgi:SAM-dependent methyltransferase